MKLLGVLDLVDTQGKGYKLKKDWFVSGALEAASIPHIRIKVKANYTVDEIRDSGLNSCLREAEERLSNCDILYVSFDVDSMDCDLVSRGTGTPVPNGLTPQEAENIVNYFLKLDKTVAVEMVEINPLLDNKGNKMAETSLDVLVSNVKTISGSLA